MALRQAVFSAITQLMTVISDFHPRLTADLNRWRAFLAISDFGSLTKAAQFLGSNQPMLSRQLNALERECGARLFNRTGRGMELSEVGQRIFPQVAALLSDARHLEAELRGEARKPAGVVTLGTLPSIGSPLASSLFRIIRQRYPAVSLKIFEGSSGQIKGWLAESRVDIAILYRYGATLPEQDQLLAHVDSYLIGAKGDRLTKNSEVPFKRLDRLPFTLPSAPDSLRATLDSLAHSEQVTLVPVLETDSLILLKQLVASERLYTVLPLHAVWSEVAAGQLQASRIVSPSIQRMIAMVMAKSKGPPRAVSAVADQIMSLIEIMGRRGMWHTIRNAAERGTGTASVQVREAGEETPGGTDTAS